MKTLQVLLTISLVLITIGLLAQEFEVYVSDAANYNTGPWQVAKFDGNGDNPESFNEDDLIWPQDIVILEDQEIILISSLTGNGYITKHDIETGEVVGNFAEGINGPTRMKIGADGLLYVLQWYNGNNFVLRYQLDGTFVDEFTSIGVPQSIGIDWDSDGNLYVSSYSQDIVQKFDQDGNFIETFIDSDVVGPTNIWFDESGDLMVIDYDGGAVKRFDADGNFVDVFIPGLSYPEGVDFFPNGNILIGNGGTSSVKLFDPDGMFIEEFIPSGSGGLITPNAVVIREITSVSVDENKMNEHFIYPSIGTTFYLRQDFSDEINSINIYDMTGAEMTITEIMTTGIWNSGNIKPGLYLVVAKVNGSMLMQKVTVIKE